MDDRFLIFGLSSLAFLPIFTITYLQNEIICLSKIFNYIQSKFLCLISMFIAFCLIFLNIFVIEDIIRIFTSILLILTLSLSINYTYKDYTIDEGYYISIPYFIIYSCILFMISLNEYSFYNFEYNRFYLITSASFICYILFSIRIYLNIQFSNSYFNYIAFIGLVLTTFNIILIINYKHQLEFLRINLLIFHLTHIYLYLTHLLSIKFELNFQTKSNIHT